MAEQKKNKGGRPPKFKTAADLQKAINRYFSENPDYPTISGLSLDIGFGDRESLYEYGRKPQYTGIIKNAISRICSIHEKRCLMDGRPAGSIFWLKVHGWKESPQQVDVKHDGAISVNVHIDGAKDISV